MSYLDLTPEKQRAFDLLAEVYDNPDHVHWHPDRAGCAVAREKVTAAYMLLYGAHPAEGQITGVSALDIKSSKVN